jgi:hypothetical protein
MFDQKIFIVKTSLAAKKKISSIQRKEKQEYYW